MHPTSHAHAPRSEPHEPDCLWQPPAIRGFICRSGKLLNASVQRAWGYVVGNARTFPADVEFRMDRLGEYFAAASSSQPRVWIKTLEDEGLGEVIESRPGRAGGVRMRLYDPALIARYRLAKADPQLPLPGVESYALPGPTAPADEPETLYLAPRQIEGLEPVEVQDMPEPQNNSGETLY